MDTASPSKKRKKTADSQKTANKKERPKLQGLRKSVSQSFIPNRHESPSRHTYKPRKQKKSSSKSTLQELRAERRSATSSNLDSPTAKNGSIAEGSREELLKRNNSDFNFTIDDIEYWSDDEPDTPENLIFLDEFFGKKKNPRVAHLKGVGLKKLISKLCLRFDDSFATDLIIMYPTICTSEEFLNLLIKKYNGEDLIKAKNTKTDNTFKTIEDFLGTNSEAEDSSSQQRLSVSYIIDFWLDLEPQLFSESNKISAQLHNFLKTKLRTSQATDIQAVQVLLRANTKFQNMANPASFNSFVGDYVNLLTVSKEDEKNKFIPIMEGFLNKEYKVEDIAAQITLLEYQVLETIKSSEFLKQAWSKDPKKAPNIVFYIDWFNQRNCWFSTLILKQEDFRVRAKIITKMIKLAKCFFELNNFNGVMEILSSLHSSPVSRLKTTWSHISQSNLDAFTKIGTSMSPENNSKNYRELLNVVPAPFIPYLGTFLIDLTFMDDSNETYLSEGIINLEKLGMIAKSIKTFQRFKSDAYDFKNSELIQKMILNGEKWGEDDLYKISKLREDFTPSPANFKKRGTISKNSSTFKLFSPSKSFGNVNVTGREKVSTEKTELNQSDWNVLLTGATETQFALNDIIVEKGSVPTGLYRIKKGEVSIEQIQHGNQKNKTLILREKGVFGELSVMGNNAKSFVTIKATSDPVILDLIEVDFINQLLEQEDQLAIKFFKSMAINLSSQLRNLPPPGETEKKIQKVFEDEEEELITIPSKDNSDQDSNGEISQREKNRLSFVSRFGFHENEILIKDFQCIWKKFKSNQGILYISKGFFCFYAQNLGFKTKEVFPMMSISQIRREDTSVVLTLNQKKLKIEKFIFSSEQEASEAHLIMTKVWQRILIGRVLTKKKKPAAKVGGVFKDEQEILSQEDWDAILKGSKTQIYSKDSVIIEEGADYQKLFQIVKGTLRIEKKREDGSSVVLGKMSVGMFGELSFLEGGGASATVITDEENVELQSLEGYFMNILFDMKSGLAGRFYHYLANILMERLSARVEVLNSQHTE